MKYNFILNNYRKRKRKIITSFFEKKNDLERDKKLYVKYGYKNIKIKNFCLLLINIFYLLIIASVNISKEIQYKKLISFGEIKITIKGLGEQPILSNGFFVKDNINCSFNETPSEIIVNGVPQTILGKFVYNLTEEINNITIKYNYTITNCNLMFYNLSNIIRIDFSNFDTSQITNMQRMFAECSSLESIDLTNFETSLVIDMCAMFWGCSTLKSLNISSFKLISVIDLSYAFYKCGSLTELDLSNLEAPSALYMASMFNSCKKLKFINLSNFNADNAIYMDNLFINCINLKSIDFTNFKASSVRGLGNFFFDCRSIESLDLTFFDASSVTNLGHMFYGCSSLTSINLSNFNTHLVQVSDSMFSNCKSLKYIDLSNFDTSSLTNIESMFKGCTNLTSITLTNFKAEHVQNMSSLFYGCSSLQSLDLSNFNSQNINDMAFMFYGCSSLKSLDLSNFNPEKVQSIASMFYDCHSLQYLELGNFNTYSVKNMNNTFYNCSSLISLNLKSFYMLNITDYYEIFGNFNNSLKYCIDKNQIKEEIIVLLNNNFVESETDCPELCFTNSKKYINKKNKCINECKNDDTYKFDFNNSCYASCPNGTYDFDDKYNCMPICENNFNYNRTQCLESVPIGYYLNDSKLKTIDKCDNKCEKCSEKELCNSCNNNIGYYIKYNDDLNGDNFVNCYNQTPEGFYLDTQDKMFKPYINEPSNTNYHIDYNISDLYLSSSYLSNYIYDTNTISLISSYATDFIDNTSIFIEYSNNRDYESFNLNNSNLIFYSDSDIYFYIRNTSINKYSYEMNSDINELKKKYTNITLIDLSQETKNILIETFNLDKEKDKIFILITDYQSTDSQMATSDYAFDIFLENGTKLNLSLISEDIFFNNFSPIRDLILAKFNLSEYFFDQGYDIYDKNSNFYKDICSYAHLNENDITLKDRKKYIYPNNVTLCKANCVYEGININEKIIKCECNLNAYKSNINDNNSNYFLTEEDGNFFDYLLDNINYKIFKCYKLLSNKENIKKNISFYVMLSIIVIFLIINIKIYAFDISKLKSLMIKDSIIDNNGNLCIIKEIKKIKKTKKKILLEPNKKSSKNIVKKDNNYKKKEEKKNKHKKQTLKKQNSENEKINKKTKNEKEKKSKKEYKSKGDNKKYKTKNINIFKKSNNKKNNKKIEKIKIRETNITKNKMTLIHFNNKKIKKQKEEKKIRDNINDLPFTIAINKDKRNIFQIFCSFIIEKINIIGLFSSNKKMKSIFFSHFLLSLLFKFFFNALLYSDEIVSHKYHNNGKLDFVVSLLLSLLSNILSSIFSYYFGCSELIEERVEQVLEMNKSPYYQEIMDDFLKKLKIKIIIFILNEVLIISLCFYYIIIFCIIYSYSRLSLLYNYFTSLLEDIIKEIVIILVISSLRKGSLYLLNRYIYNTSKYINEKF